jgi:hypothetical protein
MTYFIRRHRVDDERGRYRIWRWAAVACVVASANSVAGFHEILSLILSRATGWNGPSALWWLILCGAPITWIAFKCLLDVKESGLSCTLLVAAGSAYAIAAVGALGWFSQVDRDLAGTLAGAAELFGHWLMLSSTIAYARHVVIDAEGGLEVRRNLAKAAESGKVNPQPAGLTQAVRTDDPEPGLRIHRGSPAENHPTATIVPVKTPAKPSQWVNGSRRERDRYEDDDHDGEQGDRKLSKAERKQLRKLKARNRAA